MKFKIVDKNGNWLSTFTGTEREVKAHIENLNKYHGNLQYNQQLTYELA